jgi:uracil-DNA glycosylase
MLMTSEALTLPFELEPSWKAVLGEELVKPYMRKLALFLAKERGSYPVYPPEKLMFNAFWKTPFPKVEVVIVGQDPYHGEGQAHGLSFSVPKGVPPPPSLINIFKELHSDLSIPIASHGCLIPWAERGVFLLNATLTVRQSAPLSHHGQGWERFTDAVIEKLAAKEDPIVFILWGKSAQDKCREALRHAKTHHLILKSPHPSPFSAHNGFFGSRPFSQANAFLEKIGKKPIDWRLD